jgi:replicative DNA helicase
VKSVPRDAQAEWSVVGQMVAQPNVIGEVVGTQIEPDDFFERDCRLIFEAVVEMHYADQKVDPDTLGERLRAPLATIWQCDEGEVASRLYSASVYRQFTNTAVEHSKVVRRYGDLRRIQFIAEGALEAIREGELTPEEIGDRMTTEAARVTAGAAKRAELLTYYDVGVEYVKILRQTKAAFDAGLKIGVYTDMPFFDWYTKGLKPTELHMLAGEPGVGKSAVAWTLGEAFARYQQKIHLTRKAEMLRTQGNIDNFIDKRVGTLILSMEMGLEPSGGRLAQAVTGFDGGRLREGDISDDQMRTLIQRWAREKELPLIFNFAPNFRMSQMRALIVEAIRKYNVGFVVIDHFRMFDPDRKVNNPNQEDEAKVRFLKENVAKELNVAVMCLAHTVKISREGTDGRPTLRDLRGSYQVAAHCDIVSFMYRPIMYATENEINEMTVSPTQAEMIYAKNRNGALGSMDFHADFSKMSIRSKG